MIIKGIIKKGENAFQHYRSGIFIKHRYIKLIRYIGGCFVLRNTRKFSGASSNEVDIFKNAYITGKIKKKSLTFFFCYVT